MDERTPDEMPETSEAGEVKPPPPASCVVTRLEIRAALEPTCCGSGCDDCPF
jgi:hypothetical protein